MDETHWINDIDDGFEVNVVDNAMWQPDDKVAKVVDEIWEQEKLKRGDGLFNGRLFGVIDYDRRRVMGRWFEYKYYVAHRYDPYLFENTFLIPLGVSGIIAHEDYVVFGRRSDRVMCYPGAWELAPSGAVDPTCLNTDKLMVDYERLLMKELHEETGLQVAEMDGVDVIGFGRDMKEASFEVCARIRSKLDYRAMVARLDEAQNDEYREFNVVGLNEIEQFVEENAGTILPISLGILRKLGMRK
ncbi:hypothetical protein KS4_00680 [Poriferisphaera corsica]|uniref:Nudix hydrolase domain-containing protein n=1 Tax=Poriferisphaera corsica TaxID=2528020 RepID=A0A517YP91_9BACT|nr:hypothetical protein [Poriferisphaera corsica]QDU32040.1 hypothetical protein KS4_00680 [Poriferisphaera corsica]